MTRESILTGANVSKYFGALRALDEVDFKLYRGEILGIIGPNGAGKTTLLSVINGTPFDHPWKDLFQRPRDYRPSSLFALPSFGISRTFQIVEAFQG